MSDQAMKLFEALSDVDEELLERCNRKESKSSVYRVFWKYGKTIAACFCLVAVGAAAWTGYRLVTAPCGANDSASMQNNSPAALAGGEQSADTAGRGYNYEYDEEGTEPVTAAAVPESQASLMTEGMRTESTAVDDKALAASDEAAVRPEIQDMQDQTAVPGREQASAPVSESVKLGSGQESDSGAYQNMDSEWADLLEKEYAITDSRQLLVWEEACRIEPFNGYMPTFLPEGYKALAARQSSDPDVWNNMIFKWSNGEHILCLDMTLAEPMTKTELEKCDGLHEYFAQEFEREMVPKPIEGQISFTLHYPDGMRIIFDGYLTTDEMWDVADSVLK
jgi:hypothetical protein